MRIVRCYNEVMKLTYIPPPPPRRPLLRRSVRQVKSPGVLDQRSVQPCGSSSDTVLLGSRGKGQSGFQIFRIERLNLLEILLFRPQSQYGLSQRSEACTLMVDISGQKMKRLVI